MAERRDTREGEPAFGEPLVSVLKAMAHPLRLGIVAQLCEGERHVGALARRLGVPPVIVSQQLRILRDVRIVAATRTRGRVVYRVESAALRDLVRFARRCAAHVEAPAPRRRRAVPRLPSGGTDRAAAPLPPAAGAAAG